MIVARFDLINILSHNRELNQSSNIKHARIINTVDHLGLKLAYMDIGDCGQICAYAIRKNQITIACFLDTFYTVSTIATMKLAEAKDLLCKTYPNYQINALVISFDVMRVETHKLKPGELYEARRCL